MKLLFVAVTIVSAACAPAAPATTAPAAPAPVQAAPVGLRAYEGTYALQGASRVLDLRVWVDAGGALNGELVGQGEQTTFRPAGEHRFLHASRDDVTFVFTMENGRAASLTMTQGTRTISGPRRP